MKGKRCEARQSVPVEWGVWRTGGKHVNVSTVILQMAIVKDSNKNRRCEPAQRLSNVTKLLT